jgi:hypothetical protein
MLFDIGRNIGFNEGLFKRLGINTTWHMPKSVCILILSLSVLLSTSVFVSNKTDMSTFITNRQDDYVDSTALEYLQDISSKNDDVRLFNGYVTGNCLLYNDIKCFVDTRQQPYSKEFGWCQALDDLFSTSKYDISAMNKLFETYDFNYAISNTECKIDWYMSQCDNWEIVYTSDDETIRIWARI